MARFSRFLGTAPTGSLCLALAAFGGVVCPSRCGLAEEASSLSLPARRLQGYLRINTSNPPGNETVGARFLKKILDQAGIPSEILETAPGRGALYSRIRGNDRRSGLLLHHHIDVLPAAAGGWEAPPFAGEERRGRLVGRGTLDDKGLGIAQLEAFLEAARSGPLPGDLVFLATPDEETGGALGVGRLLKERPRWFDRIGDAIGEGGLVETIVDRPRLFGIEVQQKGALWLRLVATGPGGHASIPSSTNPVARIARAVTALTSRGRPMRLEPVTEKAFSAREGIGKGRPVVADLKRRLVSDPERLRNELAPRDLALMTDTIAITRIGSDSLAQNAMARSAFADLDVRFLPSTDPDELIRWVRSTIDDENVKVEVVLRAPPGPDSPQTDVYLTIQSVLKQRFPAAAVVSDVSPALSENRLLRVRGIRTYGLTPFRLNIYDQSGIHGTNERIRTDWFEEGVETMKRIVAAWAGR